MKRKYVVAQDQIKDKVSLESSSTLLSSTSMPFMILNG